MMLPTHVKIGAGTAAAGVFGVIFGWILFPALLRSQIKKEMTLSKKNDVRAMWEKLPFAMSYKLYLFNYTNAEEVQEGAIPIVKEIGPYYFDEWKEKVEVEDHEENDTITYKKNDVFYFRPDLSGPGLTGEEVITMPHLIMMSVATITSKDKPTMLKTVGKAFNSIYDEPKHVFMNVKALDILFRGVTINCSKTDFSARALCKVLKKEAADNLVFEPNNQYKFSVFGKRNVSISQQVTTVKRGIKNVMDVGQVVAVDGKPELDIWRDTCNQYQGTDLTIFPPFLTENDRLEVYFGDLCRYFKPWFQKKTTYSGIKTNRYVVNIGDFANDPQLNCFCETPDSCPPKGLMELQKCSKFPMYGSLPHYLDSDPELLTKVKGLNPDPEEHGIPIDFEPLSGTPMEVKLRIMFSMVLLKNNQLEPFKNLPNTTAPLFWIEEGLALNETFVKMLKQQLFLPKRIVNIMRWLLVMVGIFGPIGALIFHYKDQMFSLASPGSANVAKVNPLVNQTNKGVSTIGNNDLAVM